MAEINWLRKGTCLLLAAAFVFLGPALSDARAGLVRTETVIGSDAHDRVLARMARDDVRSELQALGIDEREARARIAALSDAEIARIQGKLDSLPAGAAATIVVIGIVVVALAVTDWLGVTNIYPWIDERQ